ncbi:Aryl-alcohol dehydrogenase [Colletotrichum higginsianum IMI 349063]|uniref:Aryl-alcohol dehydrogenase n=3 Tax=Colletotrichum higginsianum TaxID=80884 RepID=A0A1B7Y491_COLHI|nr:Aryl-alcohol dehydrogenase [Colletotrichum higginsianum IMI 349063]OBR06832.1 Aryl-alcohol dehydrogenase [Colletotrichum higginsianum IMI 349063]
MNMSLQEENAGGPTGLQLDIMPQQNEVTEPNEDWTGVTSSKERRRLQNRLNQRAHQNRPPVEYVAEAGPSTSGRAAAPALASGSGAGTGEAAAAVEDEVADDGYTLLPCAQKRARMRDAGIQARRNLALGTPQPVHLPLVVGLNLLTALARNTRLMGFDKHSICYDEYISPFNLQGPGLPCAPRDASSWPPFLHPTEAQFTITHHPFLDVFPIPSLRENGIRAEELGFFDEDDFCRDVFSTDDDPDGPRLLVWGESWDPRGWEANVPFLKKWGWLVRGCPELLEGTNYWRQRRGEKKLRFITAG